MIRPAQPGRRPIEVAVPTRDRTGEVRIRPAEPPHDLSALTALHLCGRLEDRGERVLTLEELRRQQGRGHLELDADLFAEGEDARYWLAERPVRCTTGSDCDVLEAPAPEAASLTAVGMVGLRRLDDMAVEIRRLRVHPDHRLIGIGTRLLEEALGFCRHGGWLKVMLDTYVERTAAIRLFERVGFRLNRIRETGGRPRLDFYLDLYREPGGRDHDDHDPPPGNDGDELRVDATS